MSSWVMLSWILRYKNVWLPRVWASNNLTLVLGFLGKFQPEIDNELKILQIFFYYAHTRNPCSSVSKLWPRSRAMILWKRLFLADSLSYYSRNFRTSLSSFRALDYPITIWNSEIFSTYLRKIFLKTESDVQNLWTHSKILTSKSPTIANNSLKLENSFNSSTLGKFGWTETPKKMLRFLSKCYFLTYFDSTIHWHLSLLWSTVMKWFDPNNITKIENVWNFFSFVMLL